MHINKQVFTPTGRIESGRFIMTTCGDNQYVAIAPPEVAQWHTDLLALLQKAIGEESQCVCIGGGKIRVDGNNVSLHGTSTNFGSEPDRQIVRDILAARFPEYQYTIAAD